MVTIKEMAAMLDVSTTTISNVIHGKTKEVSPEMVARVQKILQECNYIPNINARNLARNSSGMIGIAIRTGHDRYNNVMTDPFMGEIVGTIERAVRQRGYFTMLYISDDIGEIMHSISSWNVDGVVLFGIQRADVGKLKQEAGKPRVFIDCYIDDPDFEFTNIGSEDQRGGYLITEYLIKNGHRKIAFLADNRMGADAFRFEGYKDALDSAGLIYTDEDFIPLKRSDAGMEAALHKLVRKAREYTAFVCASDFYAAHIINYLSDRGFRIPDDLSVTGFDDNLYAQTVRPALTTIHQDVTKKGKLAVEKLFAEINGKKYTGSSERLPVYLVERNSVKGI